MLCAPGFPSSTEDPDKPFLLDHASSLVDVGLDVTVVCPMTPGAPRRQVLNGVVIHRVRYAPRRLETLAATGSMYKEARGIKALLALPMLISMFVTALRSARGSKHRTVVYGHWWVPGGLVAVLVSRCVKSPSVVHLHGSDAFIVQNAPLRTLARMVLRKADERLAVSSELADWGSELCNKPVEVLSMPLIVDRSLKPTPVPEDGFVLAVGRLVDEKGFDVLIEALGSLPQHRRPEVVIVGVGPNRQALLEQATKAEVSLHLPGAVAPSELAIWYRRARIVAVPSRREGFGLVAAEAAAAGRAVVGTSVGAIPQIIESESSGLIVQPDDVEAFATALDKVDPQWGVNGPQRVAHLDPVIHGQFVRQLCDDLYAHRTRFA